MDRRRGRALLERATALTALLAAVSAAYTVRSGDTLSAIAARHGVTVDAIVDLNRIADPNHIVVGQRLELPGPATAGVPRGRRTYTVRSGDTLIAIADRFDTTLSRLVNANRIVDPSRIFVGQTLRIPGQRQAPAATPVDRAEAGALIERIAREWGWDPAFVKALAWQESGWQMDVVSSADAVGIMQVTPGTGEFISDHLVHRDLDLHDAEDNVTAGVAFLDYLYDLTGGNARMVLGGYYQGLASIEHNGMYTDTRRYIDNVLALKARFD